MTVIEDFNLVDKECGYACTIGFFDGLHIGHKSLIERLKEAAEQRGLRTLIVTFAQHPRELMKVSYVPKLLTTTSERLEMLESLGIDACYVIKDRQTFEFSSSYFLNHVLAEKLNVKYLLVGYDHHFGSDREHGIDYYKECGAKFGVEVEQESAVSAGKIMVSSSEIRRQLQAGKLDNITKLLGYNYFLEGTVVHGRSVGKEIGFPTANVALNDVRKLIPKEGVYSTKVKIEDESHIFKGVLNIGVRPTFIQLGSEKTIEVHILDFTGDIYGKKIKIELLKYLRAEEKFENASQLTKQIQKDITL